MNILYIFYQSNQNTRYIRLPANVFSLFHAGPCAPSQTRGEEGREDCFSVNINDCIKNLNGAAWNRQGNVLK